MIQCYTYIYLNKTSTVNDVLKIDVICCILYISVSDLVKLYF